jgi:hypothetical protein
MMAQNAPRDSPGTRGNALTAQVCVAQFRSWRGRDAFTAVNVQPAIDAYKGTPVAGRLVPEDRRTIDLTGRPPGYCLINSSQHYSECSHWDFRFRAASTPDNVPSMPSLPLFLRAGERFGQGVHRRSAGQICRAVGGRACT